ncbi:AAA family ATPase [Nonomuraea sediminis]|uniref:AAA family ATPase n=1 Tax=Nonomuraea sediminis TaxID=2835864 RepID=UPI001BDC6A5B|nr:SMC family ATPase [Nonomuraea sediminis]
MRPLLLTLDNFGSFREPLTLDFSDVDYFALVGPTGAGKSTIIDAICFALYGTVPRWGRENAIAHALAPSAADGKVGLIFESGGRRYGVVRAMARDAKGVVRTREARLEELSGDWESVVRSLAEGENVTAEVQRLTGLEYKFFTQCVVLPQGRFAEFLHAKPNERQDLLVQLLDAGVYDEIRTMATREEETARQVAAHAREQRAAFSATPQAEEEAASRVTALRDLQRDIGAELELLRARDAELERTKHELAELTGRLTDLRALTMPDEVPTLAASAKQTAEELAGLESRATTLTATEHEAEAALAGLGDRAELTAALASLDAVERLAVTIAKAHTNSARSLAESRETAVRTLEDARRQAAQALEEVRSHAQRTITEERAQATRSLADSGEAAQRSLAESRAVGERALAESQARGAHSLAQAREEGARSLADARSQAEAAAASVGELARAATAAGESLATARAEHDRLRDAHAAADLATRLTVGDPCPVCLRPVADLPAHHGTAVGGGEDQVRAALDDAERALAAAEAGDERARADLGKAETSAAMLADRAARLADELAAQTARTERELAERLAAQQRELADRLARLAEEIAEQRTTLETDTADRLTRRERELEQQVERREQELAAELARRERDLSGQTARLEAELTAQIARLEAELAQHRATLPDGADRDDLRSRLDAVVEADRRVAEARKAARACRTKLDEVRGRAAHDARRAEEAWAALGTARDRLMVLGLGEETAPPVDRADLHAAWLDLIGWRNRVGTAARARADRTEQTLNELVAQREQQAKHLHARLEEHGVHAGDHPDQLAAAVATTLTTAEHLLERIREDLAKLAELDRVIGEKEREADVAHELALRLRANAFERWLCAEALAVLVATASQTLLELSDGQYELELGDRSEIEVIDHAEAGMRRSARTLSGGETFQAALALALALSGTVARGLDSIFLDEGFGTLDPATLDTVAAALERLAAGQERMVGVVTHVQALADRVPVRFAVSRDTTGSHVRRVDA